MLPAMTTAENALYDQDALSSLIDEFLDVFRSFDRDKVMQQIMVQAPPELTGFAEVDAVLAALAEHLSLQSGLIVPSWVHEPIRRGDGIPSSFTGLANILHGHTPLAFRKRNISLRFL
jgi:hypothetical protein